MTLELKRLINQEKVDLLDMEYSDEYLYYALRIIL